MAKLRTQSYADIEIDRLNKEIARLREARADLTLEVKGLRSSLFEQGKLLFRLRGQVLIAKQALGEGDG